MNFFASPAYAHRDASHWPNPSYTLLIVHPIVFHIFHRRIHRLVDEKYSFFRPIDFTRISSASLARVSSTVEVNSYIDLSSSFQAFLFKLLQVFSAQEIRQKITSRFSDF